MHQAATALLPIRPNGAKSPLSAAIGDEQCRFYNKYQNQPASIFQKPSGTYKSRVVMVR